MSTTTHDICSSTASQARSAAPGVLTENVVGRESVAPSVLATWVVRRQEPALPLPAQRSVLVADPDVRQEEANRVARFLTRLYEVTGKDEHKAVDEVFNFMDDHLLAGRFSVCDLALAKADPELLLPSAVVSFLMVTRRAKERLPARHQFISRGIGAVARKEGIAEAEALLGKYR